jgi:hypothetical protein
MSGSGIPFYGICFTQVTISPGAISANSSQDVTVTMPGLAASDVILSVSYLTLAAGVDIGNARATAANTMKVTFQNSTASPVTPATATYTVCVARPENTLGGPDALSGGSVIFK